MNSSGRPSGRLPEIFSALAGLAAMLAPVSLTGVDALDAIERALLVGFVTFVGAHGRRWSWVAAGFLIALPARGTSLVIALVGLAVLVAATWPKRRSRRDGAIGLGIALNAVMWYPPDAAPLSIPCALAAAAILLISGLPFLRTGRRKVAKRILIGAAAFAAIAAFGVAIALVLAFGAVRSGGSAARDALNAARDGDGAAAQAALTNADDHFATADGRINGPLALPARAVPGLAQQLRAVRVTVAEGQQITNVGSDLVATADYDSLQYDGQIDLAQVEALSEPTQRANAALGHAGRELRGLQQGWLLPPLQERVDEFSDQITEARRDTAVASELLAVTPKLFGGDGQRKYLIIFMTPAELRGSGGFVGSYAELTATNGDVELTRSGRIADLIFAVPQNTRTLTMSDDFMQRYARYELEDYLQDATTSPDFPSSAQVISQLYPQSGGSPVDGVIGIDPTGMAALLKLTGPVTVPGLDDPLTAQNAVEVLTRSQYIDFPDDAMRGDILTAATRVTFEKLVSSQLPGPRKLADALSPATRSGHLRLWSPESDEQRVFERLGADGTLSLPEGADGFSVVQQNTGNNKLDAYLHRTITYLPTVDARTGALTASMRIDLHNDVPSLDLPRAVVANRRAAPTGTNVAWLTIYTRHVVTSATVNGAPLILGPGTEKGLFAWDTPLLQIPPGGSVVVELQLEGQVDLRDGYDLAILPQPVANPDHFTAIVDLIHATDPSTGQSKVALFTNAPLTEPSGAHLDLAG